MRCRRTSDARLLRVGSSALLAAAAACTGPPSALNLVPASNTRVLTECDADPTRCTNDVTFTFLGVGGFLIRAGNDALMTGPSFTRPGLLRVVTPFVTRVHSNPDEVERQLHRLFGDSLDAELSRVRAVLVGHSHYDHAMDVPTVMRTHTPTARIVGGLTTKRILVGDSWVGAHRSQIDSIPLGETGTAWRVGRWVSIPGNRFRVMALKSSHAANALGLTIANDEQDDDRDDLPRNAWGWLLGDPYAYLIDVLDGAGATVFRILYQDTAPNPGDAILPPFPPADQHPLDVVIICAGNFANVEGHPLVVAGANRPRFMIVGHWEDFFHSMDDPPTPIPFMDTRELRARLDTVIAGHWVTPEPGGRIRVLYSPR